MKCISVKLIILSVLILLQSCIKDDYSDCEESALRFRFRYTLNNQYSDLFSTEVRQVTVYVFDTDGKYVGHFSEGGSKLENNYIMTIPLPKGSYQAVVFCDNDRTFTAGWLDNQTNTFSGKLETGVTMIQDFRVMLNNKEGAEGYLVPESIPGELYAGYVEKVFSTRDLANIIDIGLMQDTKNIVVKISGVPSLISAQEVPDLSVTAVNGRYNYDNSIDTSHRVLKYTPHTTSVTGNVSNNYLKTMRLVTGHAPMLTIKLPSVPEYVFNRDLTELILSTPQYKSQEDIDREDTFVFEINFSQADNDIVATVSINGWKINPVIPATD